MNAKKMFLSQNIADKNSELLNMYFQLNKLLDNFVNWMQVNLAMDKLATELHHKYAHRAPLTADIFSDYNALYSYRSKYNAIEGVTKDYDNIIEGIVDILNYLIDIDNKLSEAKKIGKEEDNDDYIKFISEQFLELRVYKNQFILLYDKIEYYLQNGNTLQDIDHRYEDFLVGE